MRTSSAPAIPGEPAKLCEDWWAQFRGPYNKFSGFEFWLDWQNTIRIQTLAGEKVFYRYEDYHEYISLTMLHYKKFNKPHPSTQP